MATGEFPIAKFPDTGQGPTLPAGFPKDSHQACYGNSFLLHSFSVNIHPLSTVGKRPSLCPRYGGQFEFK